MTLSSLCIEKSSNENIIMQNRFYKGLSVVYDPINLVGRQAKIYIEQKSTSFKQTNVSQVKIKGLILYGLQLMQKYSTNITDKNH